MNQAIIVQPMSAGQKDFEFALMGIGFFSLFPIFALFPIGNSSGMQVSLILAIVLMFLLILQSMKSRVRLLRLYASDWAFIGFALMLFISTIVQLDALTDDERRLFFNNYIGGILPTVLIYFVVRIGMNSRRRIELMLKWLLISTAVSCAYGILDYIVVAVLGRDNLSWLYNNPSFTGLPWGSAVEFGFPRARGFMSEPNILTGLLLAVLPLALYRGSLLLIGLILIAMVLTVSPVVLLLVPVLLWIFASRIGRALVVKCFKSAKLFLMIVTILAGILFLVLSDVSVSDFFPESAMSKTVNRLPGNEEEIEDPSTIVRMDTMSVGWRLFLEKPILGHGYGTLSLKVPLYQSDEALRYASPGGQVGIHSFLMSILATNGLAGVAAVGIWFLCVATSVRRIIRYSPEHRSLAWAWLSSFIIMVVYLCLASSQWPALYFVPVIAAVTASLPGVLVSGPYRDQNVEAPADVRR
ncbi:MAG: O-antigen ligase family protein [Kiritimatiellae bacterium]|nr:O-antigen ligase family protein [Kiritimatiellia bacterium]